MYFASRWCYITRPAQNTPTFINDYWAPALIFLPDYLTSTDSSDPKQSFSTWLDFVLDAAIKGPLTNDVNQ